MFKKQEVFLGVEPRSTGSDFWGSPENLSPKVPTENLNPENALRTN